MIRFRMLVQEWETFLSMLGGRALLESMWLLGERVDDDEFSIEIDQATMTAWLEMLTPSERLFLWEQSYTWESYDPDWDDDDDGEPIPEEIEELTEYPPLQIAR